LTRKFGLKARTALTKKGEIIGGAAILVARVVCSAQLVLKFICHTASSFMMSTKQTVIK
jgi:hypothetical protein